MFEPLYRSRPAHRWTNGDLAAKLGADLGLPPDDEQRWILDTIFAEVAPDRPASFEVAVISPRQNIKTSTLGIAALADLFVFGVEKHLWTAHHGDTLGGTFGDFKTWINSNQDYADLVDFYEGHQDMSIRHRETGGILDFQSRTGKAGRGLTGVKRITLDEALYLEPKHVGAVYPTMLTMRDAQVRIGSSAGLLMSEELRRKRDRGRSGKDGRLAYVEYGAKRKPCMRVDCLHEVGAEGCALDDRDLWWQASCALWSGRISEQSIEDLRNSMPPAEFMREMLSWWEDPESEGGALSYDRWLTLGDPDAQREPGAVFGLDLTGDRDVWISVAWQREDGDVQVMLANEGRPLPVRKAVEECARLCDDWGARVATAALGDDLEAAGVPVEDVSGPEFAAACGDLEDAINDGTIHHGNQPALDRAIKAAKWRRELQNGERALQLADAPEVGPAAAVVRALHVVTNRPNAFFGAWR